MTLAPSMTRSIWRQISPDRAWRIGPDLYGITYARLGKYLWVPIMRTLCGFDACCSSPTTSGTVRTIGGPRRVVGELTSETCITHPAIRVRLSVGGSGRSLV